MSDAPSQKARLEDEIHKLAGREFDISSPKQLGELLFEDMGLDGGQRGPAGVYDTSDPNLDRLARQGVQLAAKVLEWRRTSPT